MSRMWGAALDHIVEVEVVTSNGSILRANQDQNSDLFFVSSRHSEILTMSCPEAD